jgi:putative SOS response-associated peptidase YedK
MPMCSHYQAIKDRERYRRHFGVEPPDDLGKFDVWPMYAASFIRRPREADAGDEAIPEREVLAGQFGLIPHWATDTTFARHTYNARSETVAEGAAASIVVRDITLALVGPAASGVDSLLAL